MVNVPAPVRLILNLSHLTALNELKLVNVTINASPEPAPVLFQLRSFTSSSSGDSDSILHLLSSSTTTLRHFQLDNAAVLQQLPPSLIAELTSLCLPTKLLRVNSELIAGPTAVLNLKRTAEATKPSFSPTSNRSARSSFALARFASSR
jgi:hypothetical protein